MGKRRKAVILLLVLLSSALLAALVAPLALLGGVASLESGARAATLRHRLAAESVIALLPDLIQDENVTRALDQSNRAVVTFELEDVSVAVLIQDDTAKLPIRLARQSGGPPPHSAALQALQSQLALPDLGLRRAGPGTSADGSQGAPWANCLEDLFAAPVDRALYGRPDAPGAWTQYITPLGAAVHAYRAAPAVLAAACADLGNGLGLDLVRIRQAQLHADLSELLGRLDVSERIRGQVRARLTATSERYSLLVRTRRGADVRQRFMICTADATPRALLDWEVAP